eukprot:TRINITY_DN32984_c0_g2_i2.p2 TRINITY_DN32984_c0_g2~~TRINITY_DN32984_c0_g2_i2.p2  ORF type:complete len:124 (+),score=14.83 TRINITY_DN32984_c0_g2_i2:1-372(+)
MIRHDTLPILKYSGIIGEHLPLCHKLVTNICFFAITVVEAYFFLLFKFLFCSTFITKSSVTMEMVVLGSKTDLREDISFLCGKLLPILERLELLGEDKMGQGLKVFRRLVTSLKELTIRKLAP